MKDIESLMQKDKLNVYEMQEFLKYAQEESEYYNCKHYEEMFKNIFNALKDILLVNTLSYDCYDFSIELAYEKFKLEEGLLNIEKMFKVMLKQPFYSKIQENIIINKGKINEKHTVNAKSFCSRSLTKGFLIGLRFSDTIIKSKNKYKSFFPKHSLYGSFLQDYKAVEPYGNSFQYNNRKKFELDSVISRYYNESFEANILDDIDKKQIINETLAMFYESEIINIQKMIEHYSVDELINFYILVNKAHLHFNTEKMSKNNLDLYELETDIVIK